MVEMVEAVEIVEMVEMVKKSENTVRKSGILGGKGAECVFESRRKRRFIGENGGGSFIFKRWM